MGISTKNIILIGMPGCGKSSIGSMVSKTLQMDFCDLDNYIEEKEQASISELFTISEDHFRHAESRAVAEIYQKHSLIISTGGGIVTRPENMTLLGKTGIIFYLERPIEMILNTSDLKTRPLLAKDNTQIYTLFGNRKHLYEKYCHFRIKNDQSFHTAVDQIINIVRGYKEP